MPLFTGLGKFTNFGLLVVRIGIGIMMMVHGIPKIEGGPELWTKVGSSITHLGIHEFFAFWGFMASISEGVGGLLVLLGMAFRPACIFLFFTMLMASITHIKNADELAVASHAIELCFLFFGLFIIGPGRFSVDKS